MPRRVVRTEPDGPTAADDLDLSRVAGALWDPTVESITWCKGLDGRMGGRVTLKNGTGRNFFDSNLLTPYVNAWKAKRAELLKPPETQ